MEKEGEKKFRRACPVLFYSRDRFVLFRYRMLQSDLPHFGGHHRMARVKCITHYLVCVCVCVLYMQSSAYDTPPP